MGELSPMAESLCGGSQAEDSDVLVVEDLVSCLLCSQKGNGTLRQRNFPSLEACLDYLGIVFSSQSIRKPLEPQGLLLLESLVTVVQGRDVGAAEYT